MDVLDSVILGIVQGLTEFLPVSSSGHLLLLRHLLGAQEIPILFDVLLHLSTLAVVVIVFRRRIAGLLAALFRLVLPPGVSRPARIYTGGEPVREDREVLEVQENRENRRLWALILLASAVTAGVGLLIDRREDFFLRNPRIASLGFIVTGLLLAGSPLYRGGRSYADLEPAKALLIGLAQGIGVVPGISRSGITISASLACGLERRPAGEFSFLIAIPAMLGAAALKAPEAGRLLHQVSPAALIAGMAASFAVGYLCLRALLWLVRRGRLYLFSFYLIPAGVATFLLL